MSLPTVITTQGLQPQSPASLRSQMLASVAAIRPGYTANLPGTLIEDISSTDVQAIVLCDQARVETVNSLTPLGANAFLLSEQGQMLGIPIGEASNTSVYVQFTATRNSSPLAGYVIAQGFTVSDGTSQYRVVDGGVTGSSGQTPLLFCTATAQGSWPVPAGTVTQLVTSVPPPVVLTVTNPSNGTPGDPDGETEEDYRARVQQANLAASQGMPRYLKTLIGAVPGVNANLISVLNQNGGWEIIVGGNGDPYQIGYAIFTGLFDVSNLVGSVIGITGITQANPGVVTTNLNHGLTTGQNNVFIAGVLGMTGANGGPYTVTVINEKTFSFGVNTSGFGAYTSGGTITPNSRNVSVSLIDTPNSYLIPFVVPPVQTVSVSVTWNTNSTNVVSNTAVQQAAQQPLVDYINGLGVGQPINLFELQAVFQDAVAGIITAQYLTRMVFSVSINGIVTSPASGTGIIAGDPESYFSTTTTSITIAQG